MNLKVAELKAMVSKDLAHPYAPIDPTIRDQMEPAKALAALSILADRGVKSVDVLLKIEEAVFGDCFHRTPDAIISEIQRLVSRPQNPNMFYRPGW